MRKFLYIIILLFSKEVMASDWIIRITLPKQVQKKPMIVWVNSDNVPLKLPSPNGWICELDIAHVNNEKRPEAKIFSGSIRCMGTNYSNMTLINAFAMSLVDETLGVYQQNEITMSVGNSTGTYGYWMMPCDTPKSNQVCESIANEK